MDPLEPGDGGKCPHFTFCVPSDSGYLEHKHARHQTKMYSAWWSIKCPCLRAEALPPSLPNQLEDTWQAWKSDSPRGIGYNSTVLRLPVQVLWQLVNGSALISKPIRSGGFSVLLLNLVLLSICLDLCLHLSSLLMKLNPSSTKFLKPCTELEVALYFCGLCGRSN